LYLPVCRINPQLANEFDFPLEIREIAQSTYTKLHRFTRKDPLKKLDALSPSVMATATSQGKWLDL